MEPLAVFLAQDRNALQRRLTELEANYRLLRNQHADLLATFEELSDTNELLSSLVAQLRVRIDRQQPRRRRIPRSILRHIDFTNTDSSSETDVEIIDLTSD